MSTCSEISMGLSGKYPEGVHTPVKYLFPLNASADADTVCSSWN